MRTMLTSVAILSLLALFGCDNASSSGSAGEKDSGTSGGGANAGGGSGAAAASGGSGGSAGSGGSGSGATGGGGTSGSGDAGGTGGSGGAPGASSCVGAACAFPGAEGFGTETPGGRGGAVIVVTTLEPSGPGSFTEAMLTAGPRIIVFEVSGVIDFEGAAIELLEEHSYVTVAGQSSPGGVTLKNVTLSAYRSGFHDAVFRFLRLRGPDVYDNLSFNTTHHLVFDHMDFSGARDETFDVTNSHTFTLQWSTITNGIAGANSQNYGALIAYKPTTRISMHHNLTAHHAGRCGAQIHYAGDNPSPEGGAQFDYRNNVTYNCGFQQILRVDDVPPTGLFYNLVGNYVKTGPDTPAESMIFGLSGDIHISDNVYEGQSLILSPYFQGNQLEAPFEYPAVTTTSSTEALAQVLASAGAWPRDAMIERTVGEVMSGTGQLGKNDDALITSGPAAPADGDSDGMPDDWETDNGLDPASAADASTLAASGYSNVEVYLAERAAALIGR